MPQRYPTEVIFILSLKYNIDHEIIHKINWAIICQFYKTFKIFNSFMEYIHWGKKLDIPL